MGLREYKRIWEEIVRGSGIHASGYAGAHTNIMLIRMLVILLLSVIMFNITIIYASGYAGVL